MGCIPRTTQLILIIQQQLLFLGELVGPDIQESLQPSCGEVRQSRRLPKLEGVIIVLRSVRAHHTALELQSTAELLCKVGEFLLACKGAQYHKYLLPFLEISILNNVREVVGDNTLE